jgi:putative spermidine/putrescine transport system permease protein
MNDKTSAPRITKGRHAVVTGAGRLIPYELTAPALIFVTVILMLPLFLMLRLSFLRYDAVQMYVEVFTLDNYIKFFKDEFYQNVLWKTLWVSAVTTIL